jgi:hypothetical protein
MPSDPEKKASGQVPLTELQFLVGEWKQQTDFGEVTVSCDWKSPGKFLLQEFHAKSGDEEFTVTVWIGWDPVDQKVRSWYFDSSGGYGEASWQQRGDGWTAATFGVLPDGRTSTSTTEWLPADNDTLVWKSSNVAVEGAGVPDSEVKYVRTK